MAQLQHYRREMRAALDGMRGLSFEERGALDAVLDLIYLHGGAVADDEDYIITCLDCDIRPWRRLRDRLIELGRIYAVEGTLRNARADRECAQALQRRAIAQAGGLASGKSRALGLCSLKDLAGTDDGAPRLIDVARDEARAEIESHFARIRPHDFQHVVAALLQGMGYAKTIVSPPGADGGTDILAFKDALGRDAPHLRVQVKHRKDPSGRDDIAALRGVLRPAREIGLFVATGGFTREARREAEGASHIRLVDFDDFLALWIAHAATIPGHARDWLKLSPIHFLDARGGLRRCAPILTESNRVLRHPGQASGCEAHASASRDP
jgi:Restriction endonuclease/Protein of unknown function (DUF1376)